MQLIDKHEDEFGHLPRGTIVNIVRQEKKNLPWLTENQIYSLRKRRHEEKEHNAQLAKEAEEFDSTDDSTMDENEDDDDDIGREFAQLELNDDYYSGYDSMDSDLHLRYSVEIIATVDISPGNLPPVPAVIVPLTAQNKTPFKTTVGRPKGSSNKKKQQEMMRHVALRDDIALTWHQIKQTPANNTRLFELIILKKKMHNLEEAIVPESTIRSRCKRGNLANVQRGRRSPLADLEPTLCCLLKHTSRMGQYVSQGDCISMANELIKGTIVGRQLGIWKLKYIPVCKQRWDYDHSYYPKEEVGWGWFYGFRNRYAEITARYVINVKHYRSTWSTHALLLDMYQMVYKLFVNWGLAIELPAPQWQDVNGKEVPKDEAIGCQVNHKLIHPDRILTMDETGDNGNQGDDIATRANKVLCETDGSKPKQGCAVDDTNWTVQGFTTLGGKAVLFVIILRKKSRLNFNEHYGFDLEAPWIGDGECECQQGILPTQEQMNRNKGEGRRFPGPISCEFNGITIPSLVVASDKGGVNEYILIKALKHLDDLNVFPRKQGVPNPTLLVDGHGSRLKPAFVQYINNLNPDYSKDRTANHMWNVALGLPHSTQHWQVGDSAEQNQAFKFHSRVKKDSLRAFQNTLSATPSIKRHHVVLICNYALKRSFMKEDKVRKAIAERGWNPLNMNCLHDKDIIQTKVSGDMTYNRANLTAAELGCISQGEGIIGQFNFNGDITKQVFENCSRKARRLRAQEEQIMKMREERKKNGGCMLELVGKVTSGKMYNNGIASVNDPDLINILKGKKDVVDHGVWMKECKKYAKRKKDYEEGEELYTKIQARKEGKVNAGDTTQLRISNADLDTLIRWKWSAIKLEKHRPPLKDLKGKDRKDTRRKKLELWKNWEMRDDPAPPLQPTDYEAYLEVLIDGDQKLQPPADLKPAPFPEVKEEADTVDGEDDESCGLMSDDGSSKALGMIPMAGYDSMESLDYGPDAMETGPILDYGAEIGKGPGNKLWTA
jgi:hypothetical protein